MKRYMKTPVDKTVPYQPRLDLVKLGIATKKVINVQAAYPRIGLTMNSIDSGNVFQVAAAVNTYSAIGQTASINIDPIMTEMAMAQVRNTLTTDFQWRFDIDNQVIYCTHRDPMPTQVTITYTPDYNDVSEIQNDTWIDYLLRLAEAHMKKSLGRSRSKYRVEGSNVSNDGEILLQEANTELEAIRTELEARKPKLVVLN
ncbi:MAG: hypothetical protein J5725_05785 [Bacteroidales bacterium]|nr:hypothetical protein [Bacteroidales bacterium]